MSGFSIVPPHLAVKAMRDNGYKNAAFALAELMDNSVQAGASLIELLITEKDIQIGDRKSKHVSQIALLDNACGMDAETLRIALQFGNGTRLEASEQTGIGKFGMGLPSSSISQCKRLDVWSWRDGVKNAYHSYLDIRDIQSQTMTEVPKPKLELPPGNWLKLSKEIGRSGTLVVWSDLDRLQWRRASTVINNTEFIIGRMYRRFLSKNQLSIRMVSIEQDSPKADIYEQYALANDPGYLIENTSTPKPWNKTPMFERFGDPQVFKISWEGKEHEVTLNYSIASKDALKESPTGLAAGNQPHGKHAARNAGLSVVRADRELELFSGFTDPSEPRDRWWGIEIDFPASLDELLGVTNNKQNAHRLNDVLVTDLDDLIRSENVRTIGELKEAFVLFNDPRGPILELCKAARDARGQLRNRIKAERSNKGSSRRRHDESSSVARATARTRQRIESGYRGKSDAQENAPREEKITGLANSYQAAGFTPEEAKQQAIRTLDTGQKYDFVHNALSGGAFFDVVSKGGKVIVTLNSAHPVHDNLLELGRTDLEEADAEELRERLSKAADGLELLILAWARYEDELDGVRLEIAQDARLEWGKHARDFLRSDDG